MKYPLPESAPNAASGAERLTLPLRSSGVPSGCAACADRFATSFRNLPGVAAAALDPAGASLRVEFDPLHSSATALQEAAGRIAADLTQVWEHRTYRIGGMDCANCAASLERSLEQLPGVSAAVNFPAARLRVEHAREVAEQVSPQIEARVRSLGFTLTREASSATALTLPTVSAVCSSACCSGDSCSTPQAPTEPATRRLSPDVLRVVASGLLLGVGLALEMAHAPEIATSVAFAGSVLAGGYKFALAGLRALQARTVGTNLLMALAAVGAILLGQWAEAAAVVFLYALGEALEGAALERTRRSLSALIDAAPAEAVRIEADGSLASVPAAALLPGDQVLVRPGARIPADGEIVSGASEVSEAAITGESLPRSRAEGDAVYAGSLNGAGALTLRVTAAGEDSTLARILHLVEEAQARKAPAQALVERVGNLYTPFVLVAAFLLAVLGPLVAPGPNYVYRALTLLVVACPCALIIATPVAYVTAIARAARSGVLVKGGAVLERLAGVGHIAFDKTGTLTTGRPEVRAVCPAEGVPTRELLRLAAAAERASEHPLASAVLREAERIGLDSQDLPGVGQAQALPGRGIAATLAATGEAVLVGNLALMREQDVPVSDTLRAEAERAAESGGTALAVAHAGRLLGILAVSDGLRSEASTALMAVTRLGVAPSLLTGDRAPAAHWVAAQVGIRDIHAELLPEDKLRHVERLSAQESGRVAFVGDGINDAPALAAAGVGVAMGAGGTAAALEAADVALVKDDLSRLPQAIRLARATRAVVRQNVVIALGTVVLLLISTFAGELPLFLGVLAHEGSALLVILNALRLLSPVLTRLGDGQSPAAV